MATPERWSLTPAAMSSSAMAAVDATVEQAQFVGLEIAIPTRKVRRATSSVALSKMAITGGAGADPAIATGVTAPPNLHRRKSDSELLPLSMREKASSPAGAGGDDDGNVNGGSGGGSGDVLSPEERRRMSRVLEGKPPFGGQRQQRRVSCRHMLKMGVGSTRSLEGWTSDSDNDNDGDGGGDGGGDGDGGSDCESGKSDAEEEGDGTLSENGRSGAAAAAATVGCEGKDGDGANCNEDRQRATELCARDYSFVPGDSGGKGVGVGAGAEGGNAARTLLPNIEEEEAAPHFGTVRTSSSPPSSSREAKSKSKASVVEAKVNAKTKTKTKAAVAAEAAVEDEEEEEEEDLTAEALSHLSACALCALYERLRDMSDRGYTAKSRFDDIDVNRPKRPVTPWAFEEDTDEGAGDSDSEMEDVVVQTEADLAWVWEPPGANPNANANANANANVDASPEPETERPKPDPGLSSENEGDDLCDADLLAAMKAAKAFGASGVPSPPPRGMTQKPRRSSIRWAADEVLSEASDDESGGAGEITPVPAPVPAPASEPYQNESAPPQIELPPQWPQKRRPSILRRSSFLSKAESIRSMCSSISAGTDDTGNLVVATDNDDTDDENSGGGSLFGRALGPRSKPRPIKVRRVAAREHDGLQTSLNSSSSDFTDEDMGDDDDEDEDSDADEHLRSTTKQSNVSTDRESSGRRGRGKAKRKKKTRTTTPKDKKTKEKIRRTKFLTNTRSAGSVIRRLMEEVEMMARRGSGFSGFTNDMMMMEGGISGGSGGSIMSEFRRWVEESRTGQQDALAPTTESPKQPQEGPKGQLSEKKMGQQIPTKRKLPLCRSSYFKPGSFLSLMMEQGIEIVYFGSCPVNEVNYCLCANRATCVVTVVFLGSFGSAGTGATSLLHGCCAQPCFSEHRNPIPETESSSYDGWSNVVRLHEEFCSPLLRRRRDAGWGETKLDEISRRVDALGRELCGEQKSEEKGGDGGAFRVSVTGHGKGAALATAFGFFYAAAASGDSGMDDLEKGGRCTARLAMPVRTFTYGSPRVGDAAFRSAYQHLEQTGHLRHARFVSRGDIIPLLPVFSLSSYMKIGRLFKHVGVKVTMPETVGSSGSVLMDTSYSPDMGWFAELERACSESLLSHIWAINSFGESHSLSEYYKGLQRARVSQECAKTLEKSYQTEGVMATNEKNLTERKYLCALALLAVSVVSCVVVFGRITKVSNESSERHVPASESGISKRSSLPSCPLRFYGNMAASFGNKSEEEMLEDVHAPEEQESFGLEEVSILGATESLDEPAQGLKVNAETGLQATYALENPNSGTLGRNAEPTGVFPDETTHEALDVQSMASRDKRTGEAETLISLPSELFEGASADGVSRSVAHVFGNPSGLTFVDQHKVQAFKWGLSTESSICHIIDRELIQEAKKRAQRKSFKVETDARSFARTNIIPNITLCTAEITIGCKDVMS